MNPKIFISIAIIVLVSCKSSKQENFKKPPPPFPVIEVPQENFIGYTEFPTNIQGSNNNEVRAKIAGYIEQLYVDEGQFVQAGQALLKLETNLLSQNANAAQSGVTAAQTNIAAAQAAVDAAQVEVDKLTPLVQKNIISNVQLETAKANLQQAQSRLAQAKANYDQAKANYQAAVANVNYSIVRSPVSGVVGKIIKRIGSLVGPSDPAPITTVSDIKQLYAYFSMNESEYLNFLQKTPGATVADKLKNAPAVSLILANGEFYPEKGKLQTVTGQIDPSSGTMQFRVLFENKNGLLTNGNSGIVRIPTTFNNAIVLPQTAIAEQQGINYVFIVDGTDTVKQKLVKLKAKFNRIAIVDTGIVAGKKVVADGAGNLKDGMAIKPIPAKADSIINSLKPIFE